MRSKFLITVVGPTAIGKTALAITIAKHFETEIISCDSRQFFKEMTIGTAVPSEEELQTAPHHFIQHKSITEPYSVGDFEREALAKLEILFQKHDVVVMAGGSGLYVDAVAKGLDEFPDIDPAIRQTLNERLENEGLKSLQEELKTLDPTHFEKMAVENPHRVIRALEVCIATGKPYSSFLNKKKSQRPFKVIKVGLTADRAIIYDRINRRVDIMVEQGLIDEAQSVFSYKDLNALQTVGYKELFQYFEGNWKLDFAISEIKKNTRRFAKRQLTWFRKDEETLWFDFEIEPNQVLQQIEKLVS